MYNLGIGSIDNDSINHVNQQMDVDWFYYSPNANLTISDIAREVQSLKAHNISRMNTTGIPKFHDTTAHNNNPYFGIDGPD